MSKCHIVGNHMPWLICLCHISALFVMTIGLHFLSCRASIIIGGVLIATANIINGLSEEIGLLFASFGVLEGKPMSIFITV